MSLPRLPTRSLLLLLSACTVGWGADRATQPQSPSKRADKEKYFERQVRPLLAKHCWSCHGETKQRGGLRLDRRDALVRGGNRGRSLLIPRVKDNLLLLAVLRRGELKMPPEKALPKQDVEVLRRWVMDGAFWPAGRKTRTTTAEDKTTFTREEKDHWSFRPLAHVKPPRVTSDWPSTPIDNFIWQRLLANGLRPQEQTPANRRDWLRRVTFDLTGLPPSPRQLADFQADKSPTAHERVVERLLASPHYGERWGRHWLDVVRYADTTANDGDFVMRYAYKYRNYVVDAHNHDLPYDQFLIEQLAGDLLPRHSHWPVTARRIIATGLLMLGPKALAEGDKEQVRMDMADEQIDVVSRSMLGLTISCARCHDHKFDPIPTADYYSLASIFRGVELLKGNAGITAMWAEQKIQPDPAEFPATKGRWQQQLKKLRGQARRFHAKLSQARIDQAIRQIKQSRSASGVPRSALRNLVVWFDASQLHLQRANPKSGSSVQLWQDRSGRGNHVAAPAPGQRPVFVRNGIAGRPVVRFAGNGYQVLRRDQPQQLPKGNANRSFFVVSIPRSKNHDGEFLASISQVASWGSLQSSSGANLFQTVRGKLWFAYTSNDFTTPAHKYAKDQPAIFEQQHVGRDKDRRSRSRFWKDGKLDGVFVPKTLKTLAQPLILGSDYYRSGVVHHRSFTDIAEVLVFNRQLDPWERHEVGSYLAQKYRISASYRGLKDLVQLPASKRTKEQENRLSRVLRDHILRNDPAYKKLRHRMAQLELQLARLQKSLQPVPVMVPIEKGATTLKIHIRGNRFNLGKPAPRRFPQILAGTNQSAWKTKQSGRLELARWIASDLNPLTARVAVNRIWQGHFGRGLVATTDNFGKLGEKPSHPRLLDWLATQFIRSGWSVKHMHRLIVLSSTYRQSCHKFPSPRTNRARQRDPQNRLLWCFPRRRLSAEEIRDAILAGSGSLDREVGGGSAAIMHLYDNGVAVSKTLGLVSAAGFMFNDSVYASRRRSLYLPVIRNQMAEVLAVFDAADPSAVTARRNETTVPAQAMFMMNNSFVRQQAKSLAQRLLQQSTSTSARVQRAFQRLLGRQATTGELQLASDFVNGYKTKQNELAAWQAYCQLLFCLNEFIYVE